jgi:hypothetical protein
VSQLLHRRLHFRGGAWTPPTGLLCWFYGSLLNGSNWADRSGNGQHATLVGSPTLGADGITLGTSKYATIPATMDNAISSVLSLCAWTKFTGSGDQQSVVMCSGFSSTVRANLSIGNAALVSTHYGIAAYPGLWNGPLSTGSYVQNQWIHLAAQYKSGAWKLWIDGTVDINNTTVADVPADSGQTWYIGRKWDGDSYYWLGTLTDLMVINGELSDTIVADIMANSPGKY